MDKFLARTDVGSLKELLEEVSSAYGLGDVIEHSIIEEGYEDLNVKVATAKGRYVVKVFSRKKKEETIKDNVNALEVLAGAGIPVPKLVKMLKGETLYKKDGFSACVTEFFQGESFDGKEPTEEDLKTLVGYLAKLHNPQLQQDAEIIRRNSCVLLNSKRRKSFAKLLRFAIKVGRNYDSWGTANLAEEFEDKKKWLDADELKLVEPVAVEFSKIDSGFKKCVIHGDWQRKHVLKKGSEYCILDWGCIDYNAAVVDLAIFIALFAGEENRDFVVKEYTKANKLNAAELAAIPLLVKATYAIYLIASKYALAAKGDASSQTREWLEFGKSSLFKQATDNR